MKSIKQTIVDLFHNESIRNEIKDIIKPFGIFIYNELYFYLLLILVYSGVVFLALLGGLYYLLAIHKQLSRVEKYLDNI